jgi:ferredoxin-type protein NapH
MKTIWNNYRYLILRRITQITLMLLYISAYVWGCSFLMGNLSSSSLLGIIPMSDPYAVLQMFVAGAIISTNLLIGAAIIFSLYAIVGGRIFCSWVCPINPVTDLANYLRRKLGFNQIQKKQPVNRNVRYWVIGISLILSFIFGIAAFEFISPISMIHRGIIFGIGFGWAAALIIFLFDLFVLKNGWCGHICPLGGFYSIISKFRLLKVKHSADNCTACMKCKEVCPEVQVLSIISKENGPIVSGECTNCARCIEVCDDKALGFKITDKRKEKKDD